MSITVFSLSQIVMDIEVVGRLLANSERLHGFTNTVTGATVVLLPTVLLGKPICESILRWWNRNLSPAQRNLLMVANTISWAAAWSGGVLGIYSHWFLDAMMHADARAFWPFANGNPFITWLSVGEFPGQASIELFSNFRRISGTEFPGQASIELFSMSP